jgi:hypothetical protein
MRNVSKKRCRENQNTHFMLSNLFSENRAVYEIMSKNMVVSFPVLCTYLLTCVISLQVERSRDRSPVVSLRIFSEATDGTMCPGVDSASKNEYRKIPGSKAGRCVRLTTYHLHNAERHENQEP